MCLQHGLQTKLDNQSRVESPPKHAKHPLLPARNKSCENIQVQFGMAHKQLLKSSYTQHAAAQDSYSKHA